MQVLCGEAQQGEDVMPILRELTLYTQILTNHLGALASHFHMEGPYPA